MLALLDDWIKFMDTYAYRASGKNRLKCKGEHTTNDETFCTFSVFKWNASLFELMIQYHLVLTHQNLRIVV